MSFIEANKDNIKSLKDISEHPCPECRRRNASKSGWDEYYMHKMTITYQGVDKTLLVCKKCFNMSTK